RVGGLATELAERRTVAAARDVHDALKLGLAEREGEAAVGRGLVDKQGVGPIDAATAPREVVEDVLDRDRVGAVDDWLGVERSAGRQVSVSVSVAARVVAVAIPVAVPVP